MDRLMELYKMKNALEKRVENESTFFGKLILHSELRPKYELILEEIRLFEQILNTF